jgi:elongation factor P--(R)-beta-lysine ligase
VETPQLSAAAATDVHLESLVAAAREMAASGLAAHLAGIPDEAPARRGRGRHLAARAGVPRRRAGRRHNPEFTLLEWYRVGWDAAALMDEVDALLRALRKRTGRLPFSSAG